MLKDEKEWLFPPGTVFKVKTVGKKTIPTPLVDAKGNIIREKAACYHGRNPAKTLKREKKRTTL